MLVTLLTVVGLFEAAVHATSPIIKYDVEDLGCWKDTGNRAIPTIEGQDPLLMDSYHSRTNAKEKCLQATLKLGYEIFALQNGGWCATSATAHDTYKKYGGA